MVSESEIIARIKKRSRATDEVLIGIGDDAAVIKGSDGTDLLACCDSLIEGVHFRMDWTTPRLLGRKALAVNLSDIAAMGGVPKFAMMTIALPRQCSSEFINELFEGVFEIADQNGVSIIGGDTSSSRDSLFIDVSVLGECEAGQAVTRGGAKPGDVIYVSGSLGGSALGLRLLQDGVRLDGAAGSSRAALLKHLAPEPQSKLGRAIGEARLATAMIDISDGLSTDLRHVLDASGCGAVLHASAIPLARSVRTDVSGSPNIDALELALHGGEEYELLFTASPASDHRIITLSGRLEVAITAIGDIVAERGLQLEQNGIFESLKASGYEHLI